MSSESSSDSDESDDSEIATCLEFGIGKRLAAEVQITLFPEKLMIATKVLELRLRFVTRPPPSASAAH